MDAKEFEAALAKALGVCRAAADLALPIEAMIEHVEDLVEARCDEANEPLVDVSEFEALHEIIAAVGDVAAIGEKLPATPTEPDFPMPANLRGTA